MAFALALERLQERQQGVLVGGGQLNRALGPARRRGGVGQGGPSELPGRQRRIVAAPAPLAIDPAFGLRRALDVEPVEEMAPIQLQSTGQIVSVDRRIEGGGVAPERGRVDRNLVVPAAYDQFGAAGLAQEIEGPAERSAGVLLIKVGPEAGEQRVSPHRASWDHGGEIDQKGQPLGLLKDSPQLAAVSGPKICGAKGPELDGHLVSGHEGVTGGRECHERMILPEGSQMIDTTRSRIVLYAWWTPPAPAPPPEPIRPKPADVSRKG